MAKMVTIFIPLNEGLLDCDCSVQIYAGKLTKEEVLEVGKKLGCGKGGYKQIAIEGMSNDEDDGWLISYSRSASAKPEETDTGETFDETKGVGDLSYQVEYQKVKLLKPAVT